MVTSIVETRTFLVLKTFSHHGTMGVQRKFKGGRTRPRKPFRAKKHRSRKLSNSLSRLNQRMSQISRTIETKSGVQKYSDGLELGQHYTCLMLGKKLP